VATGETLWDARSGRALATISGTGPVFAPDSRTLATANAEGKPEVRLWDARSGKPTATLSHRGFIRDIAFAPDARTLATASQDALVRLWDARTGRLRRALRGHGGVVSCLDFSPDGRILATAGADRTVRLWDPRTGQLRRALPGHTNGILAVAFSPDGATLATTGWDSTLRLWSVRQGRLLTMARDGSWGAAVAISPDGTRLATYHEGGKQNWVNLWAVEGAPGARTLRKIWDESSQSGEFSVIAFSPDGRTAVTRSNGFDIFSDDDYRFRDLGTWKVLRTLRTAENGAVAFSPDGRILAVAVTDGGYTDARTGFTHGRGTVYLWDTRTCTLRMTLRPRPR
jgi:WD40 repeat protein